jgi:hypothetical protein
VTRASLFCVGAAQLNLDALCAAPLRLPSLEVPLSEPHEITRIAEGLHGALKKHGHAFQLAVMRRGEELRNSRKSTWNFVASEVPVETRGQGTRIDFILKRELWHGSGTLLVAECKRANPALADWCFVQTPYVRHSNDGGKVVVERITRQGDAIMVEPHDLSYNNKSLYHLGYELRSDQVGEGAPGRGAIEEACGQVLRGLNGLIHLFAEAPTLLDDKKPIPIIPVIFTTARLWISNADVAAADLHSGVLPADVLAPESRSWLWYRYNMTPGITHTLPRITTSGDLGRAAEDWFARCVAVVSADGIDDFLTTEHW